MKIKTNLRAGSGGNSATDTSTSVSSKNQNQGGKATDVVPVVVYTRCAGL